MPIKLDPWTKDDYHVDFDPLGQLRVVGPGDHMHFGSVGITRGDLEIESIDLQDGALVVTGYLRGREVSLRDPLVGHSQGSPKSPSSLAPNYIAVVAPLDGYQIAYKRLARSHWCGAELTLAKDVAVSRAWRRRAFNLESDSDRIGFSLKTGTGSLPGLSDAIEIESQPGLRVSEADLDDLIDRSNHLSRNLRELVNEARELHRIQKS